MDTQKIYTHAELKALIHPDIADEFTQLDDETIRVTYAKGDEKFEKPITRPRCMFMLELPKGKILLNIYGVACYLRNPEHVKVSPEKMVIKFGAIKPIVTIPGSGTVKSISREEFRSYRSIDGHDNVRVTDGQFLHVAENGNHIVYSGFDGEPLRNFYEFDMSRCYMVSWKNSADHPYVIEFVGNKL